MRKNSENRTVVFDLTRMFMYIGRLFPSGIERVDINYLHGLLDDDRFAVQGMLELSKDKQSYFIGLDKTITRRLHRHLYDRWILGKTGEQEFLMQAEVIKNDILRNIRLVQLHSGCRIDKSLLRLRSSRTRIIYVNCSFINIPDGGQHQECMARTGFAPVYIAHDLIPIEFPEYAYTKDKGLGHIARILAAKQLNATVVAISEHVKTKFSEVSGALGLNDLRLLVNHSGVDAKFYEDVPLKRGGRKNQFVFVSTIEPRKNHLLLLNVWRKIINSGTPHDEIPILHIIGRRGWSYQGVTDIIDHNPAIKQFVIEHNHASDEFLAQTIAESKAMLFPSFDEGWGLPIVESLALGTPVICSDLPVHRECTQGQGMFIDPIDGLGWYRAIIEVSRGETILDCSNFRPIKWSAAAEKFNEILASVR